MEDSKETNEWLDVIGEETFERLKEADRLLASMVKNMERLKDLGITLKI